MNTLKRLGARLLLVIRGLIFGIGRGLRRYPYIGLTLLIIGAAASGWAVYNRHQVVLWQTATDAYHRADYKKAYEQIKNQPIPTNPDKLRIYAQTMYGTSHLDQALTAYQKLYDKAKDPQTKDIIGNIYNEKHDYEKAVSVYEEIISADPSFTQAYVNLATVRRLQGSPSQALDVAKRGLKDNPSNVVLAELVVSLTMDDKKSADYLAAVATLKRLNPNDQYLIMLKETPVR